MLNDWKTFLTKNNVNSDDFKNNQAPPKGSMVTDLSNRGLLKVYGDDAESFLQNQLSNDIRNVTENTHQISAWCSPKGRIITTFRIFKCDDSYYLSLSHDLIETIIKKLRMYIMMSKVTVEDISDSSIQIGLAGDDAKQSLHSLLDNKAFNTETNSVFQYKTLTVLSHAGKTPRFEVFATQDNTTNAIDFWKHIAKKSTPSSKASWDYQNIQAGIPTINADSSGSWIPQMVNFIAIGGVDFKKGCYPGQEVVARLNYLGKTKRRMYRLLLDNDIQVKTGDILASENDNKAGEIVSSAINPDGILEALAVVKIAEVKQLKNCTLLDLPYPMDND